MSTNARTVVHAASRTAAAAAAILIAGVLLSTCQEFTLTNLLDGDTGEPLSITPASTTITAGQELTFEAGGGYPPYEFSIADGDGVIDPESGTFVAPSAAGETTVRVTDFVDKYADAVVTITAGDVVTVLTISPTSATVAPGGTQQFSALGGTKPRTFSITSYGSGTSDGADAPTIDSSTGLYTAGASVGTDTVTVTDADGNTASATVSVQKIMDSGVDYEVTAVSHLSGTVAGDVFQGTLSVRNIGTGNAVQTASAGIYASLDAMFDDTDVPITTVTISPLAAGTSSGDLSFSGRWPSSPADYFLIAHLTTPDADGSNDSGAAAVVTVTGPPPPDVDYTVSAITNSGGLVSGEAISGSFVYQNQGSESGSQTVYWTLYASTDTSLETDTDRLIDSGSVGSLGATATSASVPFDGTWPQTAGTWYLIVRLIAGDDTDVTNNSSAGSALTITEPAPDDINYVVSSVTNDGETTAGGALSASFAVRNSGTAAGSDSVSWVAYVSANNTLEIGTDTVVDAGTMTALNAGSSSGSLTIGGHWPSVAGTWYIVVAVNASDDTNTADNTGASAAVSTTGITADNTDYAVTAVNILAGPVAGDALSGSFDIQNAGTDAGTNDVLWFAYVSTDAALDGADTVVDTGTQAALGAGASATGIQIAGTWPQTAGTWYLIVDLSASDDVDAANDVMASTATTVSAPPPPDVDYLVSSVTNSGGTVAGEALAGSFIYENAGAEAGSQTVYWTVYASQDTTVNTDTDRLVDSGSAVSLAASTPSSAVSFNGSWPLASGTWYLLVRLTAEDDVDTTNNVAAGTALSITEPAPADVDYEIASVTNDGDTTAGGTLAASFAVQNVGTDPGTDDLGWVAYVSTNQTLEIGTDIVVDAGTQSPLNAGGSSGSIAVYGTWPSTAGDWYILVAADASDDINSTNDIAASILVQTSGATAPDIDYTVTAVDAGATTVAGEALFGSFDMQNVGTAAGANDVFWFAYLSADAALDGADTVVDTGSQTALPAGDSAASIPISGTWPDSSGTWYLLVDVSASDDTDTTNDVGSSAAVTTSVPPPDDVDYSVSSVSNGGGTVAGDTLTGSFTYQNTGVDPGSQTVYWTVYASTDTILETGTDRLVDSGSAGALAGSSTSTGVGFSGTWPQTSGTWYLLVRLVADDDTTTGNNVTAGTALTISDPPPDDIDYSVSAVTNSGGSTAGGLLSASFQVDNVGSVAGTDDIRWVAYVSSNTTLEIGTDTVVDAGTLSALAAGGSSGTVLVDGTWPSSAGTWYILVAVDASDDVSATNDTGVGTSVTTTDPALPDIDYTVTAVSAGATTVAGEALTGSFDLLNQGTAAGTNDVLWFVYVSADATLDGADLVVDTGTLTALGAGASANAVSVHGTWPATAATWYIIVDVSASDDIDTTNDFLAGSAVTTTEPPPADVDYAVSSPTSSGSVAGEPFTGSFTLTNNGADAGTQSVFWTVYVSADTVLDTAGDVVADSGTAAALVDAGTTIIAFDGTWPDTAGSYYLIVHAATDEDSAGGDNTAASGAISITEPDVDYVPAIVTPVSSPAVGQSAISESFTVHNQGVNDGSAAVYWTAYISTDATLGLSDTPIDSGSVSAVGAGLTSPAVNIDNGSWPEVGVSTTYYLIVHVSAFDEPAAGEGDNTTSAAFTIDVRDVDYGVSAVSSTGGVIAGQPLAGSFALTNSGANDGTNSVLWTAYVSPDATLNVGSDVVVTSGTVSALIAGGSTTKTFSGTWPATVGTYYLIVAVEAEEDVSTANDSAAGSGVTTTPADIDYHVPAITNTGETTAGYPLAASFSLRNDGTNNGVSAVYWTAYLSTDAALDVADPVVDAGTTSALTGGATATPADTIAGTWPATPGTYYLITTVSAADDINSVNDTTIGSGITVQAPDVEYAPVSVTNTGGTSAGGTISAEFTFTNSGTDNGAELVSWTAYVSSDTTVDVGVDQLIATGTAAAMNAGATSSAVAFSGTWPSTAAAWYLVVAIAAEDDVSTTNNTAASASVATSGAAPMNIDYDVVSVVNTGATTAGQSLAGEFTYQNIGADNGDLSVYWSTYVSSDPTLDGLDTVIDTGTAAALNTGATSAAVSFAGTWPATAGTWYVIVDLSAPDDINGTNDSQANAGVITTEPAPADIDYQVTAVTNPASTVAGQPFSGSFTVRNNGTANGTETVHWTAYVSTDNLLDIGTDLVADSGTFAALTAGTTRSPDPSFSGTWPETAGTYYVIVSVDADEDIATANDILAGTAVTISEPDVDYAVSSPTSSGSVAGEPFTGSFTLTNNGADAGTQSVFWTVYVSADTVLDTAGDVVADSGTAAALVDAGTTIVAFDGTWPDTAGSYYLIVHAATDEDSAGGDNTAASGAISITEPDVDYIPAIVTPVSSPAVGQSAISESFTVHNQGVNDGSAAVYWTAYISTDATLGLSDTPIDSGSISAVGAGLTSAAVNIDNGSWPEVGVSTTYYLIVDVSAFDEPSANEGDNTTGAAFTIDPPDVNYDVLSVTNTGDTTAGGTLSGSYSVQNVGAQDGTNTVYWTAYISTDTLLDVSDTVVDTGTFGALTSGASTGPIGFDGTWPTTPGTYYLIVHADAADDVSAMDDTDVGTAVGVTAPDIDYSVTIVNNNGGTTAGQALSADFTYRNNGTDNGVGAVTWTAYASLDTVIDVGTDILLSTGSEPALAAGATAAAPVSFAGTWPSTPDTWYILVGLNADDDTNATNDSRASTEVTTTGTAPPDVDYDMISVTDSGNSTAGQALSGDFSLQNVGADAGSNTIYWSAYVSSDTVLDAGDTVIDSGSTAALAGGASVGPLSFTGTWPAGAGTWYLIVDLSAADDVASGNDTLAHGGTATTPPNIDYSVGAVTSTGNTVAGMPLTGSFSLTNSGTYNGTETVFWTAYISTDATLNVGTDIIADSGSIAPLAAGGVQSPDPTFSGTWPQTPGSRYLIVSVGADEDVSSANDVAVSAAVTVSEPDIDYVPNAPSTVNNPATGGGAISETFTIRNDGTNNGSSRVYWTAYYSVDAALDVGDTPVDSGSITALNAGGTSAVVNIDSGSWPSVGSSTTYYLFVDLSASDEPFANEGNNSAYSSLTIQPPDINYSVSGVTNTGGTKAGYPLSGSFTLTNNGTDNGTQTVFWTAYVSSDSFLNVGIDTVIDSGSVTALATAGSSSPAFSGTWPASAGTWYLIIDASVDEDMNTGDNTQSSSGIAITEPDVNYTTSAPSNTNDPALSGSAISETFTITNSGTDPGTATVYWTAYTSSDSVLDGTDTPIDSGTIVELTEGTTSASISVDSGSWPYVGTNTTYYLIVTASSYDEPTVNEGNNDNYRAFTITAPDIDYIVTGVTNVNTPADTGTTISESFTVQNTGTSGGAAPVYWYAYYSSDTTYDVGDTLIDSNSFVALAAGASSTSIPISGTWPAESGEYYIVVKLSSSDETEPNNNTGAGGVFSINSPGEVDYIVTDITRGYSIVTAQSAVSESFDYKNAGGLSGSQAVSWTAYVSSDQTLDGGDTVIASGTESQLNAGTSATGVSITDGFWPATAGDYYLVVQLSAADETVTTNNTLYEGPFTVVLPPEYSISSATTQPYGSPGALFSAAGTFDFTVTENSGNGGLQAISWQVHQSTDQTVDAGDTLVDYGSHPALAALGSTTIQFDATWASTGLYYLLISVSAGDDSYPGNNSTVSSMIAVVDALYTEGGEDNSSTGSPNFNKVSTTGITVTSGQFVAMEGLMDAAGECDTYHFNIGAVVTGLDVQIRWKTGWDDIELDIWDGLGTNDWSYESVIDHEQLSVPGTNILSLSSAYDYYVGAYFYLGGGFSGSEGKPYQIFVSATP